MKNLEIKRTIDIDASPEIIFNALTNENELVQWFPDQVILEPKVGGKIKFTFFVRDNNFLNNDFCSYGEIVEFEINKKISYTWYPSDVPDFPKTIVTWTLEKIANNKTRVELTHSGFTTKTYEMYKEHLNVWNYATDRLSISHDIKNEDTWMRIFTCECGTSIPACKIELHLLENHFHT